MAVQSPVTHESLRLIKTGLGLVVNKHQDDLEIVSQASFYAGAMSVIDRYLNESGSVMITRMSVAEYAAEAARYAAAHIKEE